MTVNHDAVSSSGAVGAIQALLRQCFFVARNTLNTELRSRWQSLRSAAGGGRSEQGLAQARDFLNSFSPSRPILRPKLSDILRHLLEIGIKKRALRLGVEYMKKEQPGCSFSVLSCSINGKLLFIHILN